MVHFVGLDVSDLEREIVPLLESEMVGRKLKDRCVGPAPVLLLLGVSM